jgi:dUTP pyrophosphatase
MNSPSKLLYWAQPLDYGTEPNHKHVQFLCELQQAMSQSGWSTYLPGGAFIPGQGDPAGFISEINEFALDAAHALFAYLPSGVVTYGVPAEVERARNNCTPVVIATDETNNSWAISGWAGDANVLVVSPETSNARYDVADWLQRRAELMGELQKSVRRVPSIESKPSWDLIFQAYNVNSKLPTRGHDDDAGYDLYTLEDTTIQPGEFVDVPTGVAVDLPDGLWGMITGRSSTLRARKLLVSTGIIDNGYTGVLFAGCQNLSTEPVTVAAGERVAQIILLPTAALGFNAKWGNTRDKVRGSNGFGSTGR